MRQLVQSNRLVTVSGPPGIGKTRLARQVASSLREARTAGTARRSSRPLRSRDLWSMRSPRHSASKERRGRTLSEAIVDEMTDRAVLLVMDNCEHLLDACSQLTTFLLARCEGLRILATQPAKSSGVIGETTYRVGPLELPGRTG